MDTHFFAFGILSPISLLSQLILIYGYVRIKKLRQHPDMMTFWHCVSESVLDLSWIVSISSIIPSPSCQYIGALCVFFYFLNWDYILFLSLEILIKVTDPLNLNFKRRVMIYHIVSILTSLVIAIALSSVNNNNGKSGFQTCFVERGSPYEIIILVPTLFHLPVCMCTCCYIVWASSKIRHSTYARHHIYVVSAFFLTKIPASVVDGLHYKEFQLAGLGMLDKVRNK